MASQQNPNPGGNQSSNMRDSALMNHLTDSLNDGKDIGHYGRFTFVSVAQWFIPDDQIVDLLAKEPDYSADQAKALVAEVKAHKYVPPDPSTIESWQNLQKFPICPPGSSPNECNIYDQLQFPPEVYKEIGQYWEQQEKV